MIRRTFFIKFFSLVSGVFYSLKVWSNSDCHTDQDVEGPFHRANAPYRTDLASGYTGDGKKLVVSGHVHQSDCKTPLPNVTLDLWHASPAGEYDLSSNQFLFRGRIKTNDVGYYEYATLMPKGYKDGGLDRPRHIHYKVSSKGHQALTTQLYFAGDPKLAGDPFVLENNGIKRTIHTKSNSKGELEATFDIYLKTIKN